MLYKNTKYTAQEVINEIDVESFVLGDNDFAKDEIIGKARVRIGGLSGIATPDKLIKLPDADTVEVIVGNVAYDVKLEKQPKDFNGISEESARVLTVQGKVQSEKSEELQKAKAEVEAEEK